LNVEKAVSVDEKNADSTRSTIIEINIPTASPSIIVKIPPKMLLHIIVSYYNYIVKGKGKMCIPVKILSKTVICLNRCEYALV
jgi:hypothetical protein